MKNKENGLDDKKHKSSRFEYLKIFRAIVLIPIVILMLWGIEIGNIFVVVSGIALSFIISYPFKRIISKECKIKDERGYYISEKASKQTLFIFSILAIYMGIVLDTFGNQYPPYLQAGITLNISVLVIIAIYAVSYTYNKRKYGN